MPFPVTAIERKWLSARVALLVVFTASAALAIDAMPILSAADSELKQRFAGAAYADIFGFGLLPTWVVMAAMVLVAAILAWRWSSTTAQHSLVAASLVAFGIASVADYQAHDKLLAVWQSQVSAK